MIINYLTICLLVNGNGLISLDKEGEFLIVEVVEGGDFAGIHSNSKTTAQVRMNTGGGAQ